MIPGEQLFGDEIDLWMSIIAMDGQLGLAATPDDFRSLVEAHWARGARLLQQDFEECGEDDVRFVTRLAELLPSSHGGGRSNISQPSVTGEIKLKVGSVSRTFSGEEPVDFCINGQGAAPHIALMGKNGSGKTTTGVQIAIQIVKSRARPHAVHRPEGRICFRNGQPSGSYPMEFRISEVSKLASSRFHSISCPILRLGTQASRKPQCSFVIHWPCAVTTPVTSSLTCCVRPSKT